MAEPNAAAVQVGSGLIYWAPLGTAEPTAPTGSFDTAWVKLGFTEAGSQFVFTPTVQDLNVGEQLDPIKIVETARTISAEFNLVEVTATNLQRVLNGGTLATTSGYTTFEPAATGSMTRAMLMWVSDASDEMWLFRQVIQVGTITRQNRKSALAMYTAQFRAEIPATGAAPIKVWETTAIRA